MSVGFKTVFSIFVAFLKLGPFTFGGGYALIPALEREVVDRKGWLDSRELADVFAVAGSMPGAVAVNSASFVGYRVAGVFGALAALLGIFLPTFVLMIGLSLTYVYYHDNPKIAAAFTAIRATVAAFIVYAAVRIAKTAIIDFASGAIAAIAVATLYFGSGNVHPAWIVVFGAAAGVIVVRVRSLLGKKPPFQEQEAEPVYDYMI